MGRRVALLIATYQYQDAGLRQLTAPAHDAEALAAVLRDPDIAGFDVTTLINEPHHRVGEAIGDFYGDRRRDDLTLLYFTGHGLKDDDGRLYLAMSNTRRDGLLFTALSAEQIDQAMEGCASRQKVLILDCCYSGAYPAGRLAKADGQVHTLERFQGRGRTVLTASDSTQYSFEGNRPRGEAVQSVFTHHLVAGLRDGSADLDGDGDITLDELYGYVHDRVVEEMPQQRPKRQDNVQGRIVIARNVNWTLPIYLRNAIASPIANDRLGALDALAHLHRIGNDTVRTRAWEEVERLADDDSRAVSAAAASLLQRLTGTSAPARPAHEPSPTPETEAAVVEPGLPTQPEPARDPAAVVTEPEQQAAPEPTSASESVPASAVDEVPQGARAVEAARIAAVAWPGRSTAAARPSVRDGTVRHTRLALWRQRVGRLVRGRWLVAVCVLLAVASAVLLGASSIHDSWVSPRWYARGMAAVALIAAVVMVLPKARPLAGPGVFLGAAAASVWGLVYLAGDMTFNSRDEASAIELAGHLTFLVAAALAGSQLRGMVRIADWRPSDMRGWVIVALNVIGAGATAVGFVLGAYQIARIGPRYAGATFGEELTTLARCGVVAAAFALLVAQLSRLLVPRRLGLAILAGWIGGSAAITLGVYLWAVDWDPQHVRYPDAGWHAVMLGCGLLVLAVAALLSGRLAERVPVPVSTSRLVAGFVVLPVLLIGAGAVAVHRTAHAPGELRTAPFGVAVSPDGRRAYIAALLAPAGFSPDKPMPGRVLVLDTESGRVVGHPIPVGDNSRRLVVGDDGDYVYVTNSGSDSVTVISTLENTPVGEPIPVGKAPREIISADNGRRLFVVGADTVSIIDTRSNKTVGTAVPLDDDAGAVRVSPDGKRLYLTNSEADSGPYELSVIDVETRTVVGKPVPLSGRPGPMILSPNGDRVYVTIDSGSSGPKQIMVYDTVTTKSIGSPISIGRDVFTLAMSPDGRRLYVTSLFGGSLSVIDTRTGATIGSPVSVGTSAADVEVSPDGRRIYVTGGIDAHVSIVKADDLSQVTRIEIDAS